MEFLKQYWPLIALFMWFGYKWLNTQKVLRLLPELKNKGAVIIDVRTTQEYSSAHAPGTINIPLNNLSIRLSEIPRNTPIVLCCASGTRSGMAKIVLKKNGYQEVYNVGSWYRLNSKG